MFLDPFWCNVCFKLLRIFVVSSNDFYWFIKGSKNIFYQRNVCKWVSVKIILYNLASKSYIFFVQIQFVYFIFQKFIVFIFNKFYFRRIGRKCKHYIWFNYWLLFNINIFNFLIMIITRKWSWLLFTITWKSKQCFSLTLVIF